MDSLPLCLYCCVLIFVQLRCLSDRTGYKRPEAREHFGINTHTPTSRDSHTALCTGKQLAVPHVAETSGCVVVCCVL